MLCLLWNKSEVRNGDTQWKRLYENIFNEQETKDYLQEYLRTLEQIYQKAEVKAK